MAFLYSLSPMPGGLATAVFALVRAGIARWPGYRARDITARRILLMRVE
jgi:hypothetical protein